jgi:hypothetical protein
MSAAAGYAAQLREIFGERLKMVAAFGADSQTCAIVDSIAVADLDRCAAAFGGKAAPLLMLADELPRALDAFPLELNEIISTRRLLEGADLLAALTVPPEDVRRACEAHARGHLLHLREGYIEAAGDRKAIARLVAASAVPFRALVTSVAKLDGTSADDLRTRLNLSTDGFPAALRAAEQLVEYVDRWNAR